MMNNKKAQTGHTIVKSLVWFIFLIIVLFSIVLLVRTNITNTIDIKNVEAEVFYYGSLSALSFKEDLIDRSYNGIIDLNKFNNHNLESKIYYGEENYHMTAKFTLFDKSDNIIKEFIYNQDGFDKYEPLTKSTIFGPGSATKVLKEIPIMIKDNDKYYSGLLKSIIIYPNK
jgi:hypothetical protein